MFTVLNRLRGMNGVWSKFNDDYDQKDTPEWLEIKPNEQKLENSLEQTHETL